MCCAFDFVSCSRFTVGSIMIWDDHTWTLTPTAYATWTLITSHRPPPHIPRTHPSLLRVCTLHTTSQAPVVALFPSFRLSRSRTPLYASPATSVLPPATAVDPPTPITSARTLATPQYLCCMSRWRCASLLLGVTVSGTHNSDLVVQ